MSSLKFSQILFWKVIVNIILFSIIPELALGNGGGKWAESLNFVYETDHHKIATGKKGNVILVDQSGQQTPVRIPFDIEDLHKELGKKANEVVAAGSNLGNLVTVGFSIIMKCGEGFEACHKTLSISSGKTAVFESGGTPSTFQPPKGYEIIGASNERKAQDLSKVFEKRLEKGIVGLNKAPILGCQAKWQQEVKNAWSETKTGLHKVGESIEIDSIYNDHFDQICSDLVEMPLRKVANLGSAIDSEQFLLKHLIEKTDDKEKIVSAFESVNGKYKSIKLNILKEEISRAVDDSILSVVKNHLDSLEVGFILHLHSTNEICSCCAYSLAAELLYSEIAAKIPHMATSHNAGKEGAETIKPFFLVLASCSKKLEPLEGNPAFYRRVGIGNDVALAPDTYENDEDGNKRVKLAKEIFQNSFLQKLF
ncbi:MAG: hypothetical protein K2P93_05390 [Alphaproteobacteria bacterium]|nr:hypothetical protein [Alphaproteobacteria bacterium]